MKKERKIDAQKSAIKKVVESSNQKIENHVTKKRERGITLIALVVTIIIMLILAAVTLNMALGDNGLIQMAKFAANKYEEAAINESLAMKGLVKEKPDRAQLKIGDVVDYTPDPTTEDYTLEDKYSGYDSKNIEDGNTEDGTQTIKQEEYTWKIMNIGDDGTVDIMGKQTKDMTKVYLKGATGYNNGVYLLNDICEELYGNTELDAKARSINLDDIERHMTEEGKEARSENSTGLKYGEPQIYSDWDNTEYPSLAEYEKHVGISNDENEPTIKTDGIEESNDGKNLGDGLTIPLEDDTAKSAKKGTKIIVKQTRYKIRPAENFCKEPEFYHLILQGDYWIASRCSNCQWYGVNFGIRYYESDHRCAFLFSSEGSSYDECHCLAPIVSLGPNIQFTENGDNGWKLSKQ